MAGAVGEGLSPPEGEEGQRQVGFAEILNGLLVGLKDLHVRKSCGKMERLLKT